MGWLRGNLFLRLHELCDYSEVKRTQPNLFAESERTIFYYRSDNLSDKKKENIIGFATTITMDAGTSCWMKPTKATVRIQNTSKSIPFCHAMVFCSIFQQPSLTPGKSFQPRITST